MTFINTLRLIAGASALGIAVIATFNADKKRFDLATYQMALAIMIWEVARP